MYRYIAYEGGIDSEFELSPLMPAPPQLAPGSLFIRRANDGECLCQNAPSGLSIQEGEAGKQLWNFGAILRLHWQTVGCFELYLKALDLRELIVRPLPDLEPAILTNFIINNALGLHLLVEPQVFTLHASAIRLHDQFPIQLAHWDRRAVRGGVAFAGRSGAGKSTLAAAMLARGHELYADDLTVLDMDTPRYSHGQPDIFQAFPQMKLDDPSLRQLEMNPDSLAHVHSAEPKRAYHIEPAHVHAEPIRALYLLDDDDAPAPSVEPLTKQQAFAAFIGASYHAHIQRLLGVDVFAELGRTKLFMNTCATLAEYVPVRRLKRPRDLSRLNEVVDCVEADAAGL